ncbi:MAG: cardiolipin synthase [Oscillospiraceae bacterium]|nr:cardiolipin synthase [Oscillospiraceae bacterium]
MLLLLLQIGILFYFVQWLGDHSNYFWGANILFAVIVVLRIVANNDNPTVKITWILLIMVLPLFGLLLYLYIKSELGHRMMIDKCNEVLQFTESLSHLPEEAKAEELPEGMRNLAIYLRSGGFPAFRNTDMRYYPSGETAMESMIWQLRQAKEFIFLEFFIVDEGYMWGRVLEVLAEKAQQGVEVRVMYDGTCAIALLPYDYPQKLEKLGIACKMFSPLRPFVSTHYNNRDHRKVMVIDGKVGFTGGINLADEYINRKVLHGHWKDNAIMLRGDAVKSMTLMFLQMWNVSSPDYKAEDYTSYLDVTSGIKAETPGYVIPYADSPLDRRHVGELVYMDIINQAKRYVHIMTPYFIVDNELVTALTFAAERGVDVVLILPHKPDKQSAFAVAHTYYRNLLDRGVKIYEYSPGFVHSKVMVSDDTRAVVGTINFDYRSLYHHFECAIYMHEAPVIANVEKDIQDTLKKCVRVNRDLLRNDPVLRKLAGRCLRVISPLM